MNLSVYWQKEKRFLTQVAAGLAVFLIFYYTVDNFASGAREDVERAVSSNDGLQRSVEQMIDYEREIRDRDALEGQLEDIESRIAIPLPDVSEGDMKEVQFKKSLNRVYNTVSGRAGRVNLALPRSNEIRFDVDGFSDGDPEWIDRYVTLEVVQLALDNCVEHRVRRVIEVEPEDVEYEKISGDDDRALVRHPVRLTMAVRYADLLSYVASFQEDGRFLVVEIESLEESDKDPGYLEATLIASGIRLGEAPKDSGSRSPRSGRGGRVPRRGR